MFLVCVLRNMWFKIIGILHRITPISAQIHVKTNATIAIVMTKCYMRSTVTAQRHCVTPPSIAPSRQSHNVAASHHRALHRHDTTSLRHTTEHCTVTTQRRCVTPPSVAPSRHNVAASYYRALHRHNTKSVSLSY